MRSTANKSAGRMVSKSDGSKWRCLVVRGLTRQGKVLATIAVAFSVTIFEVALNQRNDRRGSSGNQNQLGLDYNYSAQLLV